MKTKNHNVSQYNKLAHFPKLYHLNKLTAAWKHFEAYKTLGVTHLTVNYDFLF